MVLVALQVLEQREALPVLEQRVSDFQELVAADDYQKPVVVLVASPKYFVVVVVVAVLRAPFVADFAVAAATVFVRYDSVVPDVDWVVAGVPCAAFAVAKNDFAAGDFAEQQRVVKMPLPISYLTVMHYRLFSFSSFSWRDPSV